VTVGATPVSGRRGYGALGARKRGGAVFLPQCEPPGKVQTAERQWWGRSTLAARVEDDRRRRVHEKGEERSEGVRKGCESRALGRLL
jgi:hypothetical protein